MCETHLKSFQTPKIKLSVDDLHGLYDISTKNVHSTETQLETSVTKENESRFQKKQHEISSKE